MTRTTIAFTGQSQLQILEEPVPTPGPGQLLVQTVRSMISTGTESICFTRNFAPGSNWDRWVQYPFRSGYLNVGRVIAVGDGVTGIKEGDRIASRAGHASHVVVDTLSSVRKTGGVDTTPLSIGVRVPENVADEQAVWMGLAKIVQVGVRAAEHKLGDSVAVVGLGLLGQLVVQYVRLMGASHVIAIDTAEKRLAMAKAHGATHTLQMTAADALGQVKEITNGAGVDVVYDVTGFPAVFPQALPLARKFGTFVLLGDAGDPSQQKLTGDIILRGVKVVGAHDSYPPQVPNDWVRWSALQMYELFFLYLSRNQMRVDDLITHRYKPAQAADAYALLQRDRQSAMGVVFEWS